MRSLILRFQRLRNYVIESLVYTPQSRRDTEPWDPPQAYADYAHERGHSACIVLRKITTNQIVIHQILWQLEIMDFLIRERRPYRLDVLHQHIRFVLVLRCRYRMLPDHDSLFSEYSSKVASCFLALYDDESLLQSIPGLVRACALR